MGNGYQAHAAKGSQAGCREGRCRVSTTITVPLFEAIRASAKGHYASVSEEIARALAKAYPIPTKATAEASPQDDGAMNHNAKNPS